MQAPIAYEMLLVREEYAMSSPQTEDNRFLTAPIGRLFLRNVVPMVLVMSMNGVQNIVDAVLLGRFVGPDALAAVSVIFPILVLTIALSTLVSGGMSSLLARRLGGQAWADAASVFVRAHGLALCIALILIAGFILAGRWVVDTLAGQAHGIGDMAYTYLAISIAATPVQFIIGLHADAWRNQGGAMLVAALSVGVTLGNILLTYWFIVELDMGVAGSAWGTALAQAIGLVLLAGLRGRGGGPLPLTVLLRHRWIGGWRVILALGAPLSLSFIGIALISATVITTLRYTAGEDYAVTVAAYGVVTRIFTFTYLPMMAIAFATQSIVGNNVGAGLYQRSNATLRLAMVTALIYCAAVEVVLLTGGEVIGLGFADDPSLAAAVDYILTPMVALYLFAGPILVLAMYFMAVGQPKRAATLTLVKPFLICPALIVMLGYLGGADVIWYGYPMADSVVAIIAIVTLIACLNRRQPGAGLGLSAEGGRA